VPGVREVQVASGVRTDVAEREPAYVRELAAHHVGGQLSVAPEHVSERVLRRMRKPPRESFERFAERFGLPATDAIIGRTDGELGWTDAQRERSLVRDRVVVETGEPLLDQREVLRDATGRDIECLASRVPLRDQAGNLLGVLGVFVALPGTAGAVAAAS